MALVRGKAPESLSAYECVLQVLDYYRSMSAARVEEARGCLERATESDPEYADPWALLGMNYLDQARLRMVPRSRDQDLLDRALSAAQRAAEIAPDSALAQRSLLLVHSFRGEVDEALTAGERAIALSPNNAEILSRIRHATGVDGTVGPRYLADRRSGRAQSGASRLVSYGARTELLSTGPLCRGAPRGHADRCAGLGAQPHHSGDDLRTTRTRRAGTGRCRADSTAGPGFRGKCLV